MRLLFDEQLSGRLPTLLEDLFPGSLQVVSLGAAGASDREVWLLAKKQGCILVTKDEDFHRMSVLEGAPPKVIRIRLGNCSTRDVADLLARHFETIREFTTQDEASFLSLG